MEIVWATGAGVGLSALTGFRAFLPLAIFMFMARMDWIGRFGDFKTAGTTMNFMQSDAAIAVLAALVVLEVVFTRVPVLRKIERRVRMPLAVVAGALIFTAVTSGAIYGMEYLVVILLGGIIAFLGAYIEKGLVVIGDGHDPGPMLDISVVVLSVLVLLAPALGYLMGIATLWLARRVRRFKKMKYMGLRVLA